jgi:hypothetical protein
MPGDEESHRRLKKQDRRKRGGLVGGKSGILRVSFLVAEKAEGFVQQTD